MSAMLNKPRYVAEGEAGVTHTLQYILSMDADHLPPGELAPPAGSVQLQRRCCCGLYQGAGAAAGPALRMLGTLQRHIGYAHAKHQVNLAFIHNFLPH
jgi:hypothetical protein